MTVIEKQKLIYSNAYEYWTPIDDLVLQNLIKQNKSLNYLAQKFNRNPGSIKSRLVKLYKERK